ncbi:MAG: acyl-CoA dehydratase activase-related protein [Bacteroidales bacterium]|jgi:predicted nucleotide-binding protein (sugar kinase/HSP70/actin superfamily)|nr:acyl-CoA dehydratase activase-related protein [Bacteroidales bacterium]
MENILNVTNTSSSALQLNALGGLTDYRSKQLRCKGCENLCIVTKFSFATGKSYYSGNKCEKVFSNKGESIRQGANLYLYKNELLNVCGGKDVEHTRYTLGIPRVLNMFENLPFWSALLRGCGMEVVLSSPSTMPMYEKGLGTIMSDSICFPAKLVHGHIYDLAERKVQRIFYPMVIYERMESTNAVNAYNCPIVSSYTEVIRSSIHPEQRWNIPLDSPVISFSDERLLERACYRYLHGLGVNKPTFRKAFEAAKQAQTDFRENIKSKAAEIIENAFAANRTLIVLAGRPYHTDSLINTKVPDMLAEMGADVVSEDAVAELTPTPALQVLPQWTYPNRIYQAAAWVGEQRANVHLVQINSFGCGPDAITINETRELLKSKGKPHTLVRVDEITSTGSLRLRLRSMLESFVLRNPAEISQTERTKVAFFEDKDRHRTILAPCFSHIYSRLLPPVFALGGFKLVNLPPADKESVETGLKYANNEICYPAIIVIGDIIKALQSGKYDLTQVAIGITQTGGQCRASTYLSLIKKALISAGFEDVPVIAIGTEGKIINSQPGFDVNWLKLLPVIFAALCYTDSLATMYYSTVTSEVHKGAAAHLLDKYLRAIQPKVLKKNISGVFALLRRAIKDFNAVETDKIRHPKIGIVGEIYIKYNTFGNANLVDWLVSHGIEVVVPPLIDFFLQSFVNIEVNRKAKIRRSSWSSDVFVYFLEQYANGFIRRTGRAMSKYLRYEPTHSIRNMSEKAAKILNLANQFGEGWLIPGEIAAFAESGVNNVVSVQPFGCIANHVVAKGVEKRIRDRYPDMNLLFLDFDSGMSEVNILNRLHFMVKNIQ